MINLDTVINIFVGIVFIVGFFVLFWELLYLYSKRSYLKLYYQQKNNGQNNSILKNFLKKCSYLEGGLIAMVFRGEYIDDLLMSSGQPFNLTKKEFLTLYRLIIWFSTTLILLVVVIFPSVTIIEGFIVWLLLLIIPWLWLVMLANRRLKEFDRQFGSFIDMLLLAVSAGMNFENALSYVTDKFTGVIGQEFRYVNYEMRYGYSLNQALQHLVGRVKSLNLRKFIVVIRQAKKMGVPFSQILSLQSESILAARIQRAEELSMTASVKISIPLVFFIFPALLILYLAPAILQLLGI